MNVHEALEAVVGGDDLSETQAYETMMDLMGGQNPPERVAGFLAALAAKGETSDELAGFARGMREKAIRIHPHVEGRLTDTCGTGGAPVKGYNVSTTGAFVAAADGIPIAKHGNRSNTRPCGSADILEALGVDLDLDPKRVEEVIGEVGVGFLFAPAFHPAMKHAAGPRKALGIRTVFNLLGPLTNPADAKAQVLGVFDPELVEPMARALGRLGVERAIVLHGSGMDEANPADTTQYAELRDGDVRLGSFTPQDVGLDPVPVDMVTPLPPAEAAEEARRILAGGDGPRADFVALNAGLALVVGGRAKDAKDGLARARDVLASGQALEKLDAFVEATQRGRTA